MSNPSTSPTSFSSLLSGLSSQPETPSPGATPSPNALNTSSSGLVVSAQDAPLQTQQMMDDFAAAVQDILGASCGTNDQGEEVTKFDFGSLAQAQKLNGRVCIAIEQLLLVGMREVFSFFGGKKKKDYIEFLQQSRKAKKVFDTANALPKAKTPRGKGRAVIQYALFTKQLVDILDAITQNTNLIREWYDPHSIFHSTEKTGLLLGILGPLDVVDFTHDTTKMMAYLQQTDFDHMPTDLAFYTNKTVGTPVVEVTPSVSPPTPAKPLTQPPTPASSTNSPPKTEPNPLHSSGGVPVPNINDTEEVRALRATVQQLQQALQQSQDRTSEKAIADAKFIAEVDIVRRKSSDQEKTITFLTEALNKSDKDVESLKQQLSGYCADLKKFEEKDIKLSSKNAELEAESMQLRRQLSEVHETVAKMQTEENSFKQSISSLTAKLEDTKSTAEQHKRGLTDTQDLLNKTQDQLKQTQRLLNQTQDQLKQSQDQVANNKDMALAEEGKQRDVWAKERASLLATAEKQNADLQSRLQIAEKDILQWKKRTEDAIQECTITSDKLKSACSQLQEAQEKIGQLHDEKEAVDKDLTRETSKKQEVLSAMQQLQAQIENKNAKINLLTEETEVLKNSANTANLAHNTALDELRSNVLQLNTKIEALSSEKHLLELKTNSLASELNTSTKELTSLRAQYSEAQRKIEEHTQSASKMNAQLEDTQRDLLAKKRRTNELKGELNLTKQRLSESQKIADKEKAARMELEAQSREKEGGMPVQTTEGDQPPETEKPCQAMAPSFREVIERNLAEVTEWKSKFETVTAENTTIKKRCENSEATIASLHSDLSSVKTELKGLTDLRDSQLSQISQLANELSESNNKVSKLQMLNDEAETKLMTCTRDLEAYIETRKQKQQELDQLKQNNSELTQKVSELSLAVSKIEMEREQCQSTLSKLQLSLETAEQGRKDAEEQRDQTIKEMSKLKRTTSEERSEAIKRERQAAELDLKKESDRWRELFSLQQQELDRAKSLCDETSQKLTASELLVTQHNNTSQQYLHDKEQALEILSRTQTELSSKADTLSKASQTIADLSTQVTNLEDTNQNLQQRLHTQKESISKLEDTESNLLNSELESKKVISQLKENIATMTVELRRLSDVEQILCSKNNEMAEAKKKIFELSQEITVIKSGLDVAKTEASVAKSDLTLQKEMVAAKAAELEDFKTLFAAEKQSNSNLMKRLELQQQSAKHLEEVAKQHQLETDKLKTEFRQKEEMVTQLQDKLKTTEQHEQTLIQQCKKLSDLAESRLTDSNRWKERFSDMGNELAKTTSEMGEFSLKLSAKEQQLAQLKNDIAAEEEKAKREKVAVLKTLEETKIKLTEASDALLRKTEECNKADKKLLDTDLATRSLEADFRKRYAEQASQSDSLRIQVAALTEQIKDREVELNKLLELSEQQVASLGDQTELQAQALVVATSTCQELKQKLETAHAEINERNSTINQLVTQLEASVPTEKYEEALTHIRQLELTLETLQNKVQLMEEEMTQLKHDLNKAKEEKETFEISLQRLSQDFANAMIAASANKKAL
ncbi:FYVE and coiled-coil domain-containing protein 1 [Pelomyxa schiedti]|nr:FYVE and coiled-coil domain-containing protein 1 [Pelomyxa schiedti]